MTREVKFNGRPIWAEVSLSALEHNLRAIQRHIGGRRKVLAVVKANAYGHGAVGVAKALAKAGADWFGVTCTAEGVELREAGIRQPILVLTGFWPGEEEEILRHRLTPTIIRVEQLRLLERAAAKFAKTPLRRGRAPCGKSGAIAEFHLKIDSGMNRLGIQPADVARFLRALSDCSHLRLAGTFTHFASSEVFTSDQTEQQEHAFAGVLERLRAARISPGIVHLANSAAIAARPSTWADMVRPGALLYGYHQFYDPHEMKPEMEAKLPSRPVLSLRARIISLKEVPAGQGVGYNARFVTRRPSRIAVIAAGYADGLVRQRTNRGEVIVRGRRAPLVGTISMDLAMVDVTDLPDARVGDVATIYGTEDGCALWASEVAQGLGTVTSELLCAVGKRVPRFYLP